MSVEMRCCSHESGGVVCLIGMRHPGKEVKTERQSDDVCEHSSGNDTTAMNHVRLTDLSM